MWCAEQNDSELSKPAQVDNLNGIGYLGISKKI